MAALTVLRIVLGVVIGYYSLALLVGSCTPATITSYCYSLSLNCSGGSISDTGNYADRRHIVNHRLRSCGSVSPAAPRI